MNKLKNFFNIFLSFVKGDKGFVFVFTIFSIPVVFLLGLFSIEIARYTYIQTKVKSALEAAAFAGKKYSFSNEDELKDFILEIYRTNLPEGFMGVESDASVEAVDACNVKITLSASVPLMISDLAGVGSFGLNESVTFKKYGCGVPKIELSMVLDGSGEKHWTGTLDDVKSSSKDLIDFLYNNKGKAESITVSVASNLGKDNSGNSGGTDGTGGTSGNIVSCDNHLGKLVYLMDIDNRENIKERIDSLTSIKNSTWIDIDLGYNSLDPDNSPCPIIPSVFGAPGNKKIMLLFTKAHSIHSHGNFSKFCKYVKDKGITIYSVTDRVNQKNVKDTFKGCATKEEWYFDVQNENELSDAFEQIGNFIIE